MNVILWFIGGLILAAAISVAAFHLFNLKKRNEQPLPPEMLPTDWDAVMPREKRKNQKGASGNGYAAFSRVGSKNGLKDKKARKLR